MPYFQFLFSWMADERNVKKRFAFFILCPASAETKTLPKTPFQNGFPCIHCYKSLKFFVKKVEINGNSTYNKNVWEKSFGIKKE